jgi:hypothetical protein
VLVATRRLVHVDTAAMVRFFTEQAEFVCACWIERALSETGLGGAEVRQPNWWRAELLIALRHLREMSGPR